MFRCFFLLIFFFLSSIASASGSEQLNPRLPSLKLRIHQDVLDYFQSSLQDTLNVSFDKEEMSCFVKPFSIVQRNGQSFICLSKATTDSSLLSLDFPVSVVISDSLDEALLSFTNHELYRFLFNLIGSAPKILHQLGVFDDDLTSLRESLKEQEFIHIISVPLHENVLLIDFSFFDKLSSR